MGVSSAQVWVTSALTDEDVKYALVLSFSLKRAFTSRRVAVITSVHVSKDLREKLDEAFDMVFYLENDQNFADLKLEDFAKLSAISIFKSFEKIAYLSPKMVVVKNSDEIFDEYDAHENKNFADFVFLEDMDLSVFLCKPSLDLFRELKEGLMFLKRNGKPLDLEAYLTIWMEKQSADKNQTKYLLPKYNQVLQPGNMLLGNENEVSIVKLLEVDPTLPWSSDQIQNLGVLGKLIFEHWLKIFNENVQPLLQGSISKPVSAYQYRIGHEPIAIVGMSCRYPASKTLEDFWNLLFAGEDGTSTPPPFRWLREQSYNHRPEYQKTNAGFLNVPIDEFDAKFFGITPKEVLFMDPQHRLLHEVVWEALEDGCINPETLKGSSGSVFVGSWLNDYKDLLLKSGNSEFYRTYMGTSIGAAAARISHLLELTGPAIATESGCSSAMVAVHMACQSLRLGETNLALACGINLLLHPFNKDVMPMVISPDGHCKTFCEKANGFARGEGCGVLVLKRLSDAVRDADNIWGLIRGSSVAQEGVSKSIGTPTVHTESLAMIGALQNAYVHPAQVSYVECHGTGTVVGDPLEVAAVAKSYNSNLREQPLIIGSVKTNVGHLESCSGIAGIMKVILSMHHEMIPAHRNFETLNPSIDLNSVPARIPLERTEWKRKAGKPRLAGVSSFGITGTDAHVIVEEAPVYLDTKVLQLDADCQKQDCILKLSAKTDEALEILLGKYEDILTNSDFYLPNLSYSVNTGRANFPHRVVLIGKSKEELANLIRKRSFLKGEVPISEKPEKICFLFSGQGCQYPGMAQQLYKTSPTFRMHFDFCDKILRETYKIDLKEAMWGSSSHNISRTIYSQTSIFCVEYALLKLWESWGVQPDYVLGHSLGEYAAAVCSGVLTVQDALKMVAERSMLVDQLPTGKMLVIKADQQHVSTALDSFTLNNNHKLLDYAAINSKDQTVVAGDAETILAFAGFLKESYNTKCVVLEATHAFHSSHMDPILTTYKKVAGAVKNLGGSSACGYISGVRGKLINVSEINAQYWIDHTRDSVRFLEASTHAVELGCRIFIEIGPQPVLSALTMMNSESNLLCLPSLKRNEKDWKTILNSVGKLYLKGVEIDWQRFDQLYGRKKLHQLPNHPFMGKKFWPDLTSVDGYSIHPLVGSPVCNASSTKLYQSGVNLNTHAYIKDHSIGQQVIYPGAAYLEMCLAAGFAAVENAVDSFPKPSRPMKVENLRIEAPLALNESKTCQIQTVVERHKSTTETEMDLNDLTVQIFHRLESEYVSWISHSKAVFSPAPLAEECGVDFWNKNNFKELLTQESDDHTVFEIYEKLASIGLKFGPAFRSIEKIWKGQKDLKGILIKIKQDCFQSDGQDSYIIHPTVCDAMIQAIMMLRLTNNLKKKLYVPIRIGKFVWLAANMTNELFIYAYDDKPSTESGQDLSTEFCKALLLDGNGKVLALMSGVEFIGTTVKAIEAVLEQQTTIMPDLWEEVWRPKMGPLKYKTNLELCNGSIPDLTDVEKQAIEAYKLLPLDLEQTFLELEQFVYLNIVKALHECGWPAFPINSKFEEDEVFTQLKINTKYRRLFAYFITVLEEEGILCKSKNSLEVVRNLPSLQEIEAQLENPVFKIELVRKLNVTLLLRKLGANLSSILLGKQDALGILFPDEPSKENPSVSDFYEEYGNLFKISDFVKTTNIPWLKHCKKVENQSGEKQVMRILEVGGGTGIFTSQCLEQLEAHGLDFEYTFTDISSAFFPPAQKKFEKWSKSMTFKKLNIEENPICQGFIPGYYDYICASDVIHATRDIKEALRNVHILLKPFGRFALVEQTKVNRFITYLFGLLDGFWRFEDTSLRHNHCTLSVEKWISAIETVGFERVEAFSTVNGHHSNIYSIKPPQNHETPFLLKNQAIKTWVIFHQEDSPISNFLLKQIPLIAERKIISVLPGKDFESKTKSSFTIRKDSKDDFVKLMECVKDINIEGIIYAWSLDRKSFTQDEVLKPYFYFAKSIGQLKQTAPPRLMVLSSGIVPLEDNKLEHIYSSTIWGFTKSLRNENIDINCRLIDIGSDAYKNNKDGMMQIFYEIWNCQKETQVAYSGVTRYVPKFQSYKPTLADLKLPPGTDRFQLILPDSKSIQDLQFGPLEQLVLGESEVEIQVKASALNFRDVFSVLKPSEKFKAINAIGFDLAGVVKRVGTKVSKWQVGDSVFGVNVMGNALPSHVKLNQEDLLSMGKDMTFTEAATLCAVFATSYYCLVDVAKVTPADTVLIHTASGGVGLSAIELCKYLGVKTIICTAGSRRKQNYLRSLGIQHVFHSRNTNYGAEILKVTNGRGVDVVLNSLTSEGFKEATLEACAKGARFVEMSKLSIWDNEEVSKRRSDVKYTIVDVASLEPSEWRRLMKNLEVLAKKKVINPIPFVRFDGVNIREALQYMQKAKHIGKVVCVMPEVKQNDSGQMVVYTPIFNDKSSYLITGGLGGIGFVVCQWMVEKGAKFVILAGRSQPNAATQQMISQLNSRYNANVIPVQLDVGNFEQCHELIHKKIQHEMGYPPLKGVMHCAGILQDGLIQNQDWPKFASTLNTKVNGTINLHELTKSLRLEHFVMFSSIACLFGSPGQSNHAAGNNFEDTFAHYRNSMGLPATTMNWGQWGQVGVAADIELPGLKPFSNLQGISALENALKSQRTQTCAVNIDSFILLSKLFPHVSSYLDEKIWKSNNGCWKIFPSNRRKASTNYVKMKLETYKLIAHGK